MCEGVNNLKILQTKITLETLTEFKDIITSEILNTLKKKVEYLLKWCTVFINYYGKCLLDISSFLVKLLKTNLILNVEQINNMIESVLFNPIAKLQIKKKLKHY